jgi:hypothetical protein
MLCYNLQKEVLLNLSGDKNMPEEKKDTKALGEKVWESTKEFFTRVKSDADKSIKILSLKGEVSRLRRDKNNLYLKMGETTYEKVRRGSIKDNELKTTAEEITRIDKDIQEKERLVEKIKDSISSAPVQQKEAPPKRTPKAAQAKKKSTATGKAKAKKTSSSKAAKSAKTPKSTEKKPSK